MHPSYLLLCLSFGALVKCAVGSDWCYTGCEHSPNHWGDLAGAFCGHERQSPIDIATSHVKIDPHLLNFTFVNFSSPYVIKSIINNGHTVKFILNDDGAEISGGGLNGTYSAKQFHFHWGDTEHHPGSEHMVDGHRYPMEMHIVTLKKGLSVTQAINDSEGLAVLGFFINGTEDEDMSGPWSNLTSYLTNVQDTEVDMNDTISISDLIGNVNLKKFYRYLGSLTTPNCNEAVVWTVFQEPININKKLVQLFPMKAGFTNVFRPTQSLNGRQVFASPATTLPPSEPWCYDDHCQYSPSKWHLMPHSYCGGERQSPVNIDTHSSLTDERLDDFNLNFNDKHAIKYIINTGHTVKAVLKEGVVEVSGGGLSGVYSTLQFHFHWGSASHDSHGSEHTIDSKRFPMEMHIVNKRKDLTLEKAIQTPDGLAVLGFLIEAKDKTSSGGHGKQSTSDTDAWKTLTKYLSAIKNISSKVEVTDEISIDDLLGDVNRASYYRYNGSLTTPSCNEAVVWTIFKDRIKVDQELIMLFPNQTGYASVFRPAQNLNKRKIFTSKSASSRPVPIMLLLLLMCLSAFSFNL